MFEFLKKPLFYQYNRGVLWHESAFLKDSNYYTAMSGKT